MWGWARKKKIEGKRATYQHSGEDASFLLTPDFLVLGKSGSNCCKGHLAAALTSFVKCAKRDSINCYTFRPQTLYINKGNLPRKKLLFLGPTLPKLILTFFKKWRSCQTWCTGWACWPPFLILTLLKNEIAQITCRGVWEVFFSGRISFRTDTTWNWTFFASLKIRSNSGRQFLQRDCVGSFLLRASVTANNHQLHTLQL